MMSPSIKKISVLLADDHALMRSGIRALLERLPKVEVVAEASDGAEALALMKANRPQLAFVDVAMPGLNGLEVAVLAARDCPAVKIIILSMHANQEYMHSALRAGARGYICKDADPDELRQAIETVTTGNIYLSQALSQQALAAYASGTADRPHSLEHLTPRQREILRLIAKGRRTKEIARELDISVRTVESHRTHLMEKLDIHDVAGLVRHALRLGLITQNDP
jgi:DNA-binding NarL/FixJ family response regulator